MTANASKTIEERLGTPIKTYMANIEEMTKVMNCAESLKSSDNIYKTVASFEDADIITASEVPVGSEKVKMNKLLVAAISKLAPMVRDNLQLAGEAAKRWSEQVGDDNLQEQLNASIAKLRTPVKSDIIPSYSTLSEDQRQAVQDVFQTVLKKEEPVSIDLITETIDRYNAGADGALLFNRLGLTIQHQTSLAPIDYSVYSSLLSDEVFSYLITRWESYQKMITAIDSEPRMTVDNMSDILDRARYSEIEHMSGVVRRATKGLDVTKLMSEYEEQLKPSTNYVDLKSLIQNPDSIPTMTPNMKNRLRGLGAIISQLSDLPFYEIHEAESDVDSDASYHAISVYHSIMEELTQNLTVYLYLTQTAIRNASIINDIISVINIVDNTLAELFTRVNEVTVENGVVSQEGFKEVLGKILGRKPSSKLDDREEVDESLVEYNVVVNRANEHLELVDTLFRLKLRDSNSLDDDVIKGFKDKHAKTIKDIFSVDISGMDANKLFNFMTNGIMTKEMSHAVVAPLTCDAMHAKDNTSVAVRNFLGNPDDVTTLLYSPMTAANFSFASSSLDLISHFNKISITAKPGYPAQQVKGEVEEVLGNFIKGPGSYYSFAPDWLESFHQTQIDTASGVKLSLDNVIPRPEYVGYRLITPASQQKINSTLTPNPKNKLTINSIKNNADLMKLCKHSGAMRDLYNHSGNYMEDKELGYPAINEMHEFIQGILPTIVKSFTKNPDISKTEAKQYTAGVTAIADDIRDAMFDIQARDNLTQLIYVLSAECNSTMKELYDSFNVVAEDFIAIAK